MGSTFVHGMPKNRLKPARVLPRNLRIGREPVRADWVEDVLGGVVVVVVGLFVALS